MQLARALVSVATFASLAVVLPSLAHADAKPQAATDPFEIQIWGFREDLDPPADDNDPALRVRNDREDYWEQLSVFGQSATPELERDYFNQAHCSCGNQNLVQLAIIDKPQNLKNDYSGDAELWVGSDCKDKKADRFDEECRQLTWDGTALTRSLTAWQQDHEQIVFIDANLIMDPLGKDCGPLENISRLWVLVVNRGNDTTVVEAFAQKDFDVDTQPPAPVTNFKAEPGEDGIYLSWDVNTTDVDEVYYYQALCSRADGSKLFDKPTNDSEFEAACGDVTPPAGDAGVGIDAASGDAGSSIALDKQLICGEAGAGSTSLRINVPAELGLTKNDKIRVQLLVIDRSHNPTASGVVESNIEFVHDFWEVYEDQGGLAEGGFCFVATAAYGDYDHPFVLVLRDFRDHTLANYAAGRAFTAWYYRHSPPLADFIREHAAARLAARVLLWPVVIFAGTWEYTTVLDKLALFAVFAFLVAWRRKRKAARRAAAAVATPPVPERTRRRRLGALAAGAATLLVLVGSTHVAAAQDYYDEELDLRVEETPRSEWVFEIKFGPYTPNIDDGFPAGKGPYAITFGDPDSGETDGLISQMEIDRFFLFPGGQLGAFAGVGYFQKWAHAFKEDDLGNPIYTERSSSDRTYFRLVPLHAGAVYRFTELADKTVVPLVPYAKLGLAYDLWWITKGNGGVSKNSKGDSAKGGTFGWQGSLGLSIRADAIDPGAARNMQVEMGVEHVGFFGEVTYSDVSGLGQANKLPVGDLTWSLGVNFEF